MQMSLAWQHQCDFIWLLTRKEIKARYKRTILGFLWVILNPLAQMLMIGLVFQFFVPMRIENYFLFLFAGLLPWGFFANSLLRVTPLLVQERSLIQKAAFSREVLVVAAVLANLFHTLVASLVLVFFLACLQASWWGAGWFVLQTLVLLVPVFILLFCFVLAVSLVVSALYVRLRDLNFIVQLGIQLLFYAVPVIYSLEMLPANLRQFLYFNPLTNFIEAFRTITLGQTMNATAAWWTSVFSVVFLVLSLAFFRRESKNFDDWF